MLCECTANDSVYYAYGMHEELDAPGEYILSETDGKLSAIMPMACVGLGGEMTCPTRLVPATGMGKMEYCTTRNCSLGAMVRVIGATNVTFQSVNITGSSGVGASVWGSSFVSFDSCEINNHQEGMLVGATLHPAMDSENISLLRSDVGFTGLGGVSFTGGNRTLLTPSGNLIENNRLHDFGRCIYTCK